MQKHNGKRTRKEFESNGVNKRVSAKCVCGNDLKLINKRKKGAAICDKCNKDVGRQFYQCAKSRKHPNGTDLVHSQTYDVCLQCINHRRTKSIFK